MPVESECGGHHRQRVVWAIWLTFVVVVASLGCWGNYLNVHPPYATPPPLSTLRDVAYATLQLFDLNRDFDPGDKPWQLEVARFLAPVAPIFLVVWAAVTWITAERLRLRRVKGHVVVCGLGRKGRHLVRKYLREGDEVVAIEKGDDPDVAEECRRAGALVLRGDATLPHVLRQARVHWARKLVVVCSDDLTNIQIATHAGACPAGVPPTCQLLITDLHWYGALQRTKVLSKEKMRCRLFNFYLNCARRVLAQRPLDWQRLRHDDPRQAHLVILGFGEMGEALAIRAAQTAHFANLRRPRITIVDRAATRKHAAFYAQFPHPDQEATIARIADLQFVNSEIAAPQVRRDLAAWAHDPGYLLTIAICVDHPAEALSHALNLPDAVREHRIPVLVRLSGDGDLSGLLKDPLLQDVHVFGGLADGCDEDERLDALARAIHQHFQESYGGPPWEELDEQERDANRQPADHFPVKLRALGCELVDLPAGADFRFTPEELAVLSRMEHQRWWAAAALNGWRYAPAADGKTKNKDRKTHSYMVPFDDLDAETRGKDQSQVEMMPQWLAKYLKQGIARRQP